MLASQRRERIIEMVGESGTVSVSELALACVTSESTIRRDLDRLYELGLIVKVHGGARRVDAAPPAGLITRELDMSEKQALHREEKSHIAAHAAGLIRPDDFVYLDAGTTTQALIAQLPGDALRATFVTNSVPHALALGLRGAKALVLGGEIKAVTEAVVGPVAMDSLARYHFTKGFWGANGITAESGITTPDPDEAMVKRASLERARERFVLADASKLGMVAAMSFAELADVTVITDAVPRAYRTFENIVEAHA